MYYELTKGEKKLARKVLDKGLEQEYLLGIKLAINAISDWKNQRSDTKDCYMKLVQGLNKIDQGIARLHNGKGGSRWAEVIAGQLLGGFIETDDLEGFNDKTIKVIKMMAGIHEEDENHHK